MTLVQSGQAKRAVTSRLDLVGKNEIAERLGVSVPAVQRWRYADLGFPESDYVISGTPVWRWSRVDRWAKKNGYPKEMYNRKPTS